MVAVVVVAVVVVVTCMAELARNFPKVGFLWLMTGRLSGRAVRSEGAIPGWRAATAACWAGCCCQLAHFLNSCDYFHKMTLLNDNRRGLYAKRCGSLSLL